MTPSHCSPPAIEGKGIISSSNNKKRNNKSRVWNEREECKQHEKCTIHPAHFRLLKHLLFRAILKIECSGDVATNNRVIDVQDKSVAQYFTWHEMQISTNAPRRRWDKKCWNRSIRIQRSCPIFRLESNRAWNWFFILRQCTARQKKCNKRPDLSRDNECAQKPCHFEKICEIRLLLANSTFAASHPIEGLVAH